MQSKPLIRPYEAMDRDTIVAMLLASKPWTTLKYAASDWETIFTPQLPPGREGYVLTSDRTVQAFALLRTKFLFGDYLELLVVHPDARSQGAGRRLLSHVEGVVFGHGKNLFTCVSDFNLQARRFYEQLGYREVGPLPDLLVTGSAEILLRKTAGPARGGRDAEC